MRVLYWISPKMLSVPGLHVGLSEHETPRPVTRGWQGSNVKKGTTVL
jgi:hypothetical protein